MDCRRVLVMDWVTGVKLTGLPPEEIRRLVATGQEAFLTQLLEVGFFHGDPHPGNLLKVTHMGGSDAPTADTAQLVFVCCPGRCLLCYA